MEKLSQQLDWLAREYSHVPALISEQTYLSFYQLNTSFIKACSFLQQEMQKKQLERNTEDTHTVALVFENPLLHLIFSLACLRCGLTQLSIDSKENKNNITSLLEKNSIHWALSDIPALQEQFNIATSVIKEDTLIVQVPSLQLPEFNMDNKALLVTGSGSTGKAKQMAFTFRQYAKVLFERNDPFDIKAGERFLSMVPVHFHAGKTRNLLYLLKGVSCVFKTLQKTPTAFVLDRLLVQHLYCVDLHLSALLDYAGKFDTSSSVRFPYLKSLIASGSPISVERVRQVRHQLSKHLFIVYGANEVLHVSVATPGDLDRFPDSIGKPVMDANLKLLNKDKQALAFNEAGHVHVKTPGMAESYENNPQADEENFYQGWFMPRDLVRQTEEGYLFFEGRSDDMMIHDGMNIYPIEIESLLEQLPEVKECAAFPISTQAHGDIPAVAIVLHGETQQAHETYFADYLKQEMGKRYPKMIFIMDALPRNPRGKVLKYQLKEFLSKKIRQ